jgi:glutaminyl-peptide cyclotransferase
VFGYKVVRTYPHDTDAYTQGLVYQDGFLYEGTGLNGRSGIRRVNLATGKVLQKLDLDAQYFGEGITLWRDKLIQLTWQSRIGFVYDRKSFRLLDTFVYRTEGWGLTHDGKRLIQSDGTATLYFLDPQTLKETGQIQVTDRGQPVTNLNELEYIRGEIWANVWQSFRIARIAPATGQVTAWVDLNGILSASDQSSHVEVLNGIAYDAALGRIFVTGKLWPKLFEIQVSSPVAKK